MITLPGRLSLLAIGLGTFACAHSTPARPDRVAVIPLDGIGVPPGEVSRMERTIGRRMVRAAIQLVDRQRAKEEVRRLASCGERSIDCGAEVGRAVGASHVVLGAVGRLGKTWMLRLKLLRVSESTVVRAVEETLVDPAGLDRAVTRATERLFDLSRPRPWYSRWWVWTLVGAGVTAAVVVPVVLTRPESDPYKEVPFP